MSQNTAGTAGRFNQWDRNSNGAGCKPRSHADGWSTRRVACLLKWISERITQNSRSVYVIVTISRGIFFHDGRVRALPAGEQIIDQ